MEDGEIITCKWAHQSERRRENPDEEQIAEISFWLRRCFGRLMSLFYSDVWRWRESSHTNGYPPSKGRNDFIFLWDYSLNKGRVYVRSVVWGSISGLFYSDELTHADLVLVTGWKWNWRINNWLKVFFLAGAHWGQEANDVRRAVPVCCNTSHLLTVDWNSSGRLDN